MKLILATLVIQKALGDASQLSNELHASSNGTLVNVPASFESSSSEPFPLVLGSLLLAYCLVFNSFALYIVLRKRVNEKEDTTTEGCEREKKMKDIQRNTWVYGQASESLAVVEVEEGNVPVGDHHDDHKGSKLMSWKGLKCTYPKKSGAKEDVTTLSEVTGHIKYNELVAVMGPSGGGKSTLMDILSGRKTLGSLGGQMSLLGESMASNSTDCKAMLKDVAAYVPQREHFFPNQTPEEAVEFAANLKLGEDERGGGVRRMRVRQILDLVGISHEARHRPIGGELAGGIVIRGLSGGERKRLALACAVAMKPKILFLDEITSGLDSENAVLVIDLIKKLCMNMNAAAVVVIHQPSYEVFSHFDRLILLSKGKCIYSGKVDKIPSFYNQIGRSLPEEKYLIPNDLLSAASRWDENNYVLNENPNELAETCGVKLLQDIKAMKKPTVLLQVKTVLIRHLMNHYVRNVTNLCARVMIHGATSALLGCVFWKIADTEDGQTLTPEQAQATFGAGIFLTQVFYLLPFAQISTFFFDKKLFAAESSIGLYPAWIYSFSQLVLELWVLVLCALTDSAIAVPMMGLWNPSVSKIGSFLTMFTTFCVSGVVGNALVMMTSILMPSEDLTFLFGSGAITVFLALSGGFVPFPYIADWIVWLQWISPVKYSFQAFTWGLLSGTSAETLLDTLELDAPEGVGTNILILLGVFAVCAIGSVLGLSRQKEVR